MSRFSHHLVAPRPLRRVQDELVAWLWMEPGVVEVAEVGPSHPLARPPRDPPGLWRSRLLLAPRPGATAAWSDRWLSLDRLARALSEVLGEAVLYGHHNDQVDNWRWARFEGGEEVDGYHFVGQPETEAWRFGRGPLPKPDLWTAFAAAGHPYAHESVDSALPQAGPEAVVLVIDRAAPQR